ncbi:hypothetical protein EV193_102575 [Herbihabitans rhizosphaerae]|uniref:Uncharacterized protein n=1 Tax=Herbihabitans rhizosphaerae TaxID=1872711 RepID=A0A4Q7L347_9PSEU|nr:hypothetical protein EV193_102575 [Herbihabitans rhizosphaerae]
MRWPVCSVHLSKCICDFCPVVPEEVTCSATSDSGTDTSECCLKKLACTNGWRARSSMSAIAPGVSAHSAAKNSERSACHALIWFIASTNKSSLCSSYGGRSHNSATADKATGSGTSTGSRYELNETLLEC